MEVIKNYVYNTFYVQTKRSKIIFYRELLKAPNNILNIVQQQIRSVTLIINMIICIGDLTNAEKAAPTK